MCNVSIGHRAWYISIKIDFTHYLQSVWPASETSLYTASFLFNNVYQTLISLKFLFFTHTHTHINRLTTYLDTLENIPFSLHNYWNNYLLQYWTSSRHLVYWVTQQCFNKLSSSSTIYQAQVLISENDLL